MAVERAGDLPVPMSWGFAAAGPEGARTLLVRGDPQDAEMQRDGRGAAVPCWFKSEERPGPGRLRVTLLVREFSLTEGAARGTRGHLGPGGRDQLGFVEGIMVLELGQQPGIQVRMTGSEAG
jgi:hypothetical protein